MAMVVVMIAAAILIRREVTTLIVMIICSYSDSKGSNYINSNDNLQL